jgi:hypothetical protein
MLETLLGAGKLVGMGAALAIGFWGAKKLTDKIDVFIATHSESYKELVEKIAEEERGKNGSRETTTSISSSGPA